VRHKRKDGSVFWISLTAIPQAGEGDEKQHITISQDIDERKRAEEALKASEERYRSLVENLSVGISVIAQDGRAIHRNKALMEIYGYKTKEELSLVTPLSLYGDPKDRERFLELTEKGPVKDFEVRLKRKDSTPFWALLNSISQITPSGEKQLLTVIQDIDEKKKAEEALKVSEEKFRSLLENAPVGITVSTIDGRRLEANKTLVKMQGFGSREVLLAAPIVDTYYDPEERKLLMSLLEKGPVQNY
jgi:PAS domain S-box-containing protein